MSQDQLEILERFVVENQDLERLESLLADFNIFEAIGSVRQELRHSDFLSFLMNPAQNHGLGDLFLKRFLKQVLVASDNPPLNVIDVDVADWSDTEVRREWRNIDILLYNASNKLVCAIENKVGSKEHSNQTKRYRELVSQEFPDDCTKIFVYLTPEGELSEDVDWIPYNYGDIANLIKEICQSHRSSLGPDVYTIMNHYVTLLGRHIVSDSEIAELCQKIYRRHKNALDLIFEHRPDMQSDIADLLTKLVASEAHGYGLELDHSSKSYIRFTVSAWDDISGLKTGVGWTSTNRVLLFELRNSPSALGLSLVLGPGDPEVREAIFEIAEKNRTIFKGVGKRLYPKWTQIYRIQILKKSDYEDPDLDRFEELIRSKWKQFLEKDLPKIREAMESALFGEITVL